MNYKNEHNNKVCFYGKCGFKGWEACFSPGQYKDLINLNMPDNHISSVSVPKGLKVDMYQGCEFGGRRVSLKKDKKCFIKNITHPGWDTTIGSFQITNNNINSNAHDPIQDLLVGPEEEIPLLTKPKKINKIVELFNPTHENTKPINKKKLKIKKIKHGKLEIIVSDGEINNTPFNKVFLLVVSIASVGTLAILGKLPIIGIILAVLLALVLFIYGLK
jgi:hypothetical protein